MLRVLALLLASVTTFRLADSVIEFNTMTTWMPANKVVYLAIQGDSTVEVQAKGADINTRIKCQSPKEGMYCLLWTPEHNAFGLTKNDRNNIIELNLRGFSNQDGAISYKVMSDERLIIETLTTTQIQLNGIKHLLASYSKLSDQQTEGHLLLSSTNPTKADYFNRLTLQLLEDNPKLATDASGRSTSLPISGKFLTTSHFKISSEKGSQVTLSLSASPTIPSPRVSLQGSHLSALRQPFLLTNFAHLNATTDSTASTTDTITESSTDPINDDLADDCDTEWLEGGNGLVNLDEHVSLGKIIGRGHFGEVHEVFDVVAGVEAVAKMLKKSRKMKEINGAAEINNEVAVLNKLPVHENVCRFYRAFETREYIVIIMENCGFTSLYTRYFNRRASESEVRYFLKQMVAGQLALHRASVYQNDVKLTNMMITNEGVLKIIDFGLATFDDGVLYGRMGADGYHCPEMLLRRPFHPSMIDTWNDGIIIYKMLYGNYCFGMLTDFEAYKENLRELKYSFPANPHITEGLRNLFFHLFQFEENRYTVEELAQDPWLTQGYQ